MYPKWENEINLDRLHLGDIYHCVLGQLYGRFHEGFRVLGLTMPSATEAGFEIEWERDKSAQHKYSALTTAWKKFIKERRGE